MWSGRLDIEPFFIQDILNFFRNQVIDVENNKFLSNFENILLDQKIDWGDLNTGLVWIGMVKGSQDCICCGDPLWQFWYLLLYFYGLNMMVPKLNKEQ